ncbi:MAG: tetraacyldisaccharide 4'-kinase [Alphaproteobacteria bacterium]|nr:tetraacyldisaccharide 4'-kinase [Alphaproteobacteria bacterium]
MAPHPHDTFGWRGSSRARLAGGRTNRNRDRHRRKARRTVAGCAVVGIGNQQSIARTLEHQRHRRVAAAFAEHHLFGFRQFPRARPEHSRHRHAEFQ